MLRINVPMKSDIWKRSIRNSICIENDKLSENGIIADKTMNTLLHVFEAYTELYRVARLPEVAESLEWIMDTFADEGL